MKFNFKKKYGQNFLNDENITSKIVNTLDFNENDLIIEIGPGVGALTRHIVKKTPFLICYEIDKDVDSYLNKYMNSKSKIIYDDFLNRNINEDIININYENLYLIGNLPYYITTPIILKIIESKINIKSMTFMVQKEVAERFASKVNNKEYGSITVLLNYYFDIKKDFIVSRKNFYPIPNVDSEVITFTKKNMNYDIEFSKFNQIVKDAFHMKRKNLRNNLRNYDLEKVEKILNKYNYSLNNRAENLELEVFIDLAKNL